MRSLIFRILLMGICVFIKFLHLFVCLAACISLVLTLMWILTNSLKFMRIFAHSNESHECSSTQTHITLLALVFHELRDVVFMIVPADYFPTKYNSTTGGMVLAAEGSYCD